jgi:hypothetical protein
MQNSSIEKLLFKLKKDDIEFRYTINIQDCSFQLTDVIEVGSQMLCFAMVNSKIRLFYKSRSNGSYRVAPFCKQSMFVKGIHVDIGGYTYETKLCVELQKKLAKLEDARRYIEMSELEHIIAEYELINMQEYQYREIQNVFTSDILYRNVPGRKFVDITDLDSLIQNINSDVSINKFFSELIPKDYYSSCDVEDNLIESFVFSSNDLDVTVNFFSDLKSINGERLFHIASIEGSDISDFGFSKVFYNIGFLSQKSMEYPIQLPEITSWCSLDDDYYSQYVSTMCMLNELSIYKSIQNLIINEREKTLDQASKFQIQKFFKDPFNLDVIQFLERYFASRSLDLNVEVLQVFLSQIGHDFTGLEQIRKFVYKVLVKVLKQNHAIGFELLSKIYLDDELLKIYREYCSQRCFKVCLEVDSIIFIEFIAEGFYYRFFGCNHLVSGLSLCYRFLCPTILFNAKAL